MSNSRFFKLSTILGLEILVAYVMIFALEGAARVAQIANFPSLYAPAREALVIESPEDQLELLLETVQSALPNPIVFGNIELAPQGQLANPPETINAIYLTSWSAGSASRIDYVINLARTTELNAVVVDIKDFSGEVAYVTGVPEVKQYGAERVKIRNIEALLKRLHESGIYAIARVTVFQDPVLAAARPDLAVQSIAQEGIWADYKGLGWVDPAAKEVWNYIVAIARDAASRGFDEINFDYVRFPSDGNLGDMRFPIWDRQTLQRDVIRDFAAYAREYLPDIVISADLFGLSTSSTDDLGIGQIIEDAYKYFDYVYPMVYPSHYANGYRGYAKPAEYPYEVVYFSMAAAQARLDALKLANPEQRFAKLRPWLQDFNLGATYDAVMVQAQAQAAKDALGKDFSGFLLWAPTNWYTAEVLSSFVFDRTSYDARPRTVQTP